MSKFTYRYVDGELESWCDACGSSAPLIDGKRRNLRIAEENREWSICEVCYKTACGTAIDFFREDSETARMISQATNLLLDKLTGRKP